MVETSAPQASPQQSNSDLNTRPAWARAIAQPASEFPLTPLPVLSGNVPEDLHGSLYRNGPGRLERGGKSVGHWFDGDGAILAVHFANGSARATYRYVHTAGYGAEEAQNRFLYSGYGMTAPGLLWERWGKPVKHVANTSVLALPDRLLALWEGGNPYGLDLEHLETLGLDALDGTLQETLAYSAHPKRDPETGDIFNFGLSPGLNSTLNLYRSDRTGKICQQAAVSLRGIPLVHDWVMAGRYLIFCIPPVQIHLLPVGLGLQSFSDAMEWQPQRGTQILILDRESLTVVSQGDADPWFQWHFCNGYVESDGMIILDVVRYADFQTNQFLKEIATGQTTTLAQGTLWRIRLHPQTGRVLSQDKLISRSCEFPVVKPDQVGRPADAMFLNIHRPDVNIRREVFGAIARFEPNTQTLTVADLGEHRYPSEPLYAPSLTQPDRGWVLTVVFDGKTDTSEVWVFDADGLDGEPVCRLGLPSVIPLSFHGTWRSL